MKDTAFATNEATWYSRLLRGEIKTSAQRGVEFGFAEDREFECWLREHSNEFSWIYVEQEVQATRDDHRLAFVSRKGDIIGYLKIALDDAYVLDYDRHVSLPKGFFFIQDTFVLPQFRKMGIARSMISNAMLSLQTRGYERAFCHIPSWNVASRRTYETLGFKPVGHITFRMIFGKKIYSLAPEELIGKIHHRG